MALFGVYGLPKDASAAVKKDPPLTKVQTLLRLAAASSLVSFSKFYAGHRFAVLAPLFVGGVRVASVTHSATTTRLGCSAGWPHSVFVAVDEKQTNELSSFTSRTRTQHRTQHTLSNTTTRSQTHRERERETAAAAVAQSNASSATAQYFRPSARSSSSMRINVWKALPCNALLPGTDKVT